MPRDQGVKPTMVLDVEVDVDGPGHVKSSDHDTMINNLQCKTKHQSYHETM